MADVRNILRGLAARTEDKRGVTSAEYAVLAVGIVIVVGGAILAFDLNNPLIFAGTNLTASQASLAAPAR